MKEFNYGDYIGNTLFVRPEELPKLGDHRPIGHDGDICVSIDMVDAPDEYFGYLFYNVYYANPNEIFECGLNRYYFSYAVKRDELVKYLTKEVR